MTNTTKPEPPQAGERQDRRDYTEIPFRYSYGYRHGMPQPKALPGPLPEPKNYSIDPLQFDAHMGVTKAAWTLFDTVTRIAAETKPPKNPQTPTVCKEIPPGATPGYAPKHAQAFHILDSEWVPPETLAFSTLPKLSRLSLMSVLNFMAFGMPSSPPIDRSGMYDPDLSVGVADMQVQIEDQHYLMCVAHRGRAFAALCEAAREGKVRLFGTPHAGGSRQLIDCIQFDVPLSLADEDGAIDIPWDKRIERYFELQRESDHWLWRDVHVDRASLVSWLKKRVAETRRTVTVRNKTKCQEWLIGLRKEPGPQQKRKADYQAEAMERFGLGPFQFKTAWRQAAKEVPRPDWVKPGAPRKK